MAIGNKWQITFVCGVPTQAAFNVRHYNVTSAPGSEPSPLTVASHFATQFAALYKALMNSQASFIGAMAQRIRPLPVMVGAGANNGTGPGLVAGDLQPKQVAGLISIKTAFAGRRFRGRLYVPFSGEVDNAISSVPTGDYFNRLDLLAAQLGLTQTVTAGAASEVLSPVLFSRKFELFTPTTLFVARGLWATQRRRGDFGRLNVPIISIG